MLAKNFIGNIPNNIANIAELEFWCHQFQTGKMQVDYGGFTNNFVVGAWSFFPSVL